MAALGATSTVLELSITYITLTLNVNQSVTFPGYSTTEILEVMYLPTLVWGIFSGGVGGFVSAKVRGRGLRARFGEPPGS